jgi:hypothetical protein
MFRPFVQVIKTVDKSKDVLLAMDDLSKIDVLVGVPQEKSSRPKSDDITNAELAYIHTHGIRKEAMRREMDTEMDQGEPYSKAFEMYIQSHGSPLWHSPPRPMIEPAIAKAASKISVEMAEAGKAALNGIKQKMMTHLKRAGMIGQNAARAWFTDPENNWDPNAPETIAQKGSDRPLIDTGELRKSIVYILRERGQRRD